MDRFRIVFYNIVILFIIYFLVACVFSVIYIGLEVSGLGSIYDHYSSVQHQKQGLDLITRAMYFSFITLFAVGYGDMSPFGLSKGVAMIQAFIGYVLPYAMILNYLIINPRNLGLK